MATAPKLVNSKGKVLAEYPKLIKNEETGKKTKVLSRAEEDKVVASWKEPKDQPKGKSWDK